MIELEAVSKVYGGARVVDELSFSVDRGEFFALIGRSGCGKSTTLKMINRLIPCTAGSIRIGGEDVLSFRAEYLRRRVGYVIQSIGLFPHWSVERNIATVPALLGWPEAKIRARTIELLTLLRLDPAIFAGKYPHQLSGGEQQRVGVARALAARPDVLLMDEPFGALDPIARGELQAEIVRIQRDTGTSVIFVTHDMEEALLLATRIAILDRGRLVQVGRPLELLDSPATEFVRAFVSRDDHGIRLLAAQLVASRVRAGETAPGAPVGATQSLRRALSQMIAQRADRLQVVDGENRPLGTLHLSDLVRR